MGVALDTFGVAPQKVGSGSHQVTHIALQLDAPFYQPLTKRTHLAHAERHQTAQIGQVQAHHGIVRADALARWQLHRQRRG